MADGSIEFKTDLDNAELEKKLKQAGKSVESLKRKIEGEQDKQTFIERAMGRSRQSMAETERGIEALKSKMEGIRAKMASGELSEGMGNAQLKGYQAVLDEASSKLEGQNKELEKLQEQWQKSQDKVEVYGEKLKGAEATEQELGSQAQAAAAKLQNAFSRAAESIRARMSQAASSAAAPWEAFGRRVNTMLRKVFVFGVILAGLRAIKSAISSMVGENELFHASVENLKATMGGFLSSVVGAVLPVLTRVVNALAAIFGRVAGFIDSVLGTNITGAINQNKANASAAIQAENAQKLADAQGNQAKSAKKLAKEQDKANKSLMSFDELNMLAAESSDDASDAMDGYTADVEAPELTADWTQMGFGDLGIFQQVVDWLDMIRNRIETDVEGPFARIREGLGLIRQGWGELVQGIMAGDWKMAWQGVEDIAVGAMYAIEGAFGAFLGWLDEMTGGKLHGMFEGVKRMLHGVVEFTEGNFDVLVGILTLDGEKIMQGFGKMGKGVEDIFGGLWEAIIGIFTPLVNWFNRTVMQPLEKAFNDAWAFIVRTAGNAWNGVRNAFSGVAAFFGGVFGSVRDTVIGVWNYIVAWFRSYVEPIFTWNFWSGVFKSLANGLIWAINSGLNAVGGFINNLAGGLVDVLKWLGVTGWSFSITMPQIPYLAQGAVIPPNREFLAVLGDQRSGNNIEAPESLMRQIVAEETGRQMVALMASMQSGQGDVTLVLRVGNEDLARAVSKGTASMARRGLMTAELVV